MGEGRQAPRKPILEYTGEHEDEAKIRTGDEEMYGMAQQEAWRQRPEEIRQRVAALRLEKTLRAKSEGRFRLMENTKWELERYAGLLGKRFRRSA
jgi:hypothetical protein